MKLFYKHLPILLLSITVVVFSCGSNEAKPAQQTQGIDTLQYEDTVEVKPDSLSLADSILSAMQQAPVFIDDTAALALKAKLAADTASTKISDSIKKEIQEAREYMNQKKNP